MTLSVFVYIDGRNTQQCFFERAAFAFGVFKCAEESMMIATTVIIYYSYYWRDGMPHCYFFVPIYYDESMKNQAASSLLMFIFLTDYYSLPMQ